MTVDKTKPLGNKLSKSPTVIKNEAKLNKYARKMEREGWRNDDRCVAMAEKEMWLKEKMRLDDG